MSSETRRQGVSRANKLNRNCNFICADWKVVVGRESALKSASPARDSESDRSVQNVPVSILLPPCYFWHHSPRRVTLSRSVTRSEKKCTVLVNCNRRDVCRGPHEKFVKTGERATLTRQPLIDFQNGIFEMYNAREGMGEGLERRRGRRSIRWTFYRRLRENHTPSIIA